MCWARTERRSSGLPAFSVATALHNFEPTSQSMVGLRKGQEVLVLSKNGDERGWWKGKVKGKIGYFPLAYVRETPDPTQPGPPVH